MSTFENVESNSNSQINQFNTAKIFVGNNRYRFETYTNSTGSEITIAAGTVMGRIASTGKVVPFSATATDGSQIPYGISTEAKTVANGASTTMSICIAGDVVASLIDFQGSETLDTVVYPATVEDLTVDSYDLDSPGVLTITGLKTVVAVVDNTGDDVTASSAINYGASNTTVTITGLGLSGDWTIKFAGFAKDARTVRDLLMSATLGINPVSSTELSGFDNV